MKTIIVYIILFLILLKFSEAQTVADTSRFLSNIPSLSELTDTAILNSPLLKAQLKELEVIDEEVRVEQKKWMDYLYFEGAANYGIFDNLVMNDFSSEIDATTGVLTRNEQARYYVGVSLKLPLSALSSSSNKIKANKLRREQAEHHTQQIREKVRQIIIEEYFQLKYLEESMNTFNRINQTLEISLLQAEKDLVNGNIEFDEYGILVSTAGKSKNDYLKAKNSFQAQFRKLEILAGISLKQQN